MHKKEYMHIRIKEIIKEKGMSVCGLADKLHISRQALSKQLQGKMLVETAEKIANALNVPLWELFISPDEIRKTEISSELEVNGYIKVHETLYEVHSFQELEELLKLKK